MLIYLLCILLKHGTDGKIHHKSRVFWMTYPATLFHNPRRKVLFKVANCHVFDSDGKICTSAGILNGCSAQMKHARDLLQCRFTTNGFADSTLETAVTVSGSA